MISYSAELPSICANGLPATLIAFMLNDGASTSEVMRGKPPAQGRA